MALRSHVPAGMAENFGLSTSESDNNKKQPSGLDLNSLSAQNAQAQPEQHRSVLNSAVHSVVGLVWHDENSKTRDEVEHYAGELAKSVPLFMGGGRAYAGAALMYGLDQVHLGDSTSTQAADFGLGLTKGLALKGTFDLIGKENYGIATKGALIGGLSRAADVGLTRQTYLDKDGGFNLTEGLYKTAQATFSPKMIAADVMIFGAAHGLFKAGNFATGGAIERSPLLSTMGMGTTFGLVSGTGAEMQRQADAHEQFDPVKAAVRGVLQAGVTTIAAVPGGMQMARMQSRAGEFSTDPASRPDTGDQTSWGSRIQTSLANKWSDFTLARKGGDRLGLLAGNEDVNSGANLERVLGAGEAKPVKVGDFTVGDQIRVGSSHYDLVGVDPKTGDGVIHRPTERAVFSSRWETVPNLDGATKLDIREGIGYKDGLASSTYDTDYAGLYRRGDAVFGVKQKADWSGSFQVLHLPEFKVVTPESMRPLTEPAKPLTVSDGELTPGVAARVDAKTGTFIGTDPEGNAVLYFEHSWGRKPGRVVQNLDGYTEVSLDHGKVARTYYRDGKGEYFSVERVPGEGYQLTNQGFVTAEPGKVRIASVADANQAQAIQSLLPEGVTLGQTVRVDRGTWSVDTKLVGIDTEGGNAIVLQKPSSSDVSNARNEGVHVQNLDGYKRVDVTRNLDFGSDARFVPEFDSFYTKDGKVYGVVPHVDGTFDVMRLPGADMVPLASVRPKEVKAPDTTPVGEPLSKGVWRNADHDVPIEITAFLGKDPGGREYVRVRDLTTGKESEGGIPLDEIVFERPKTDGPKTVDIDVAPEKQDAFTKGAQLLIEASSKSATPDKVAEFVRFAQSTEGQSVVAELTQLAEQSGRPKAVDLVRDTYRLDNSAPGEITISVPDGMEAQFQRGAQMLLKVHQSEYTQQDAAAFRQFAQGEGRPLVAEMFDLAQQLKNPTLESMVRDAYEMPREVDLYVPPEAQGVFQEGFALLQKTLEPGAQPADTAAFQAFARGNGAQLEPYFTELAQQMGGHEILFRVREAYHGVESAVPVDGTDKYVFVEPGKEETFRKGIEAAKAFVDPENTVPWFYDALKYYAKGEGAELEPVLKEYAAKSGDPRLVALINDAYLPLGNIEATGKPDRVNISLSTRSEQPTQAEIQQLVQDWQQFQGILGQLPAENVVAIREWRNSVFDYLNNHPDLYEAARSYGEQTRDSQVASALDYYFGTNNLATFPGVRTVDPFAELGRAEQQVQRVAGDGTETPFKASLPGQRSVEELLSGLDSPDRRVQIDSGIHLKGQDLTPEQMKRYMQFLFAPDPEGGVFLDKMSIPNGFILHYLRGAIDSPSTAPVSLDALTKILSVPPTVTTEFPPLVEQYVNTHGSLSPYFVEKLREQWTTPGADGAPRTYNPLVPQVVREAMDAVPERPPREDRGGKGRFAPRAPEAPKPEQLSDRMLTIGRVLDAELPKDVSNKLLELGKEDGRALSEVMLYNARSNRAQDIPNYSKEYKDLITLVTPQAQDIGQMKLLIDALRASDASLGLYVAEKMRPADDAKWIEVQRLISGFGDGSFRMSSKPFFGKGKDKAPPPPVQPKWRTIPDPAAEVQGAPSEPVDNQQSVVEDPALRQGNNDVAKTSAAATELTVLPAKDGVQLTLDAQGRPALADLGDGHSAQFKFEGDGLTIEYFHNGELTGRISTSNYESIHENNDLNWVVELPGQPPRQWVGNVEIGDTDSTFEFWKGVGEQSGNPFEAPPAVEMSTQDSGALAEPLIPAQPEIVSTVAADETIQPPVVDAAAGKVDKPSGDAEVRVGDVVLNPEEAKIIAAMRDGNKRPPDIAKATGIHDQVVKFMLRSLKSRGVVSDNGGKFTVNEKE